MQGGKDVDARADFFLPSFSSILPGKFAENVYKQY
jgi:hypothetical protein